MPLLVCMLQSVIKTFGKNTTKPTPKKKQFPENNSVNKFNIHEQTCFRRGIAVIFIADEIYNPQREN